MSAAGSSADLTRTSAADLAAHLAAGEVSSVEVTRAHLDRIAAVDDDVHAFLHINAAALETAAQVDADRAAGMTLPALAGCAVQDPTPVTDLEARDRFMTVLDEAQDLVGGDWDVRDDPTPRECVIPLWIPGERYPALRVGDAPASVSAAAERIEQAWNDAGMRVTRTDIGDVIEVKGESAEGELVVLRVSASASTLLGESECRPL